MNEYKCNDVRFDECACDHQKEDLLLFNITQETLRNQYQL